MNEAQRAAAERLAFEMERPFSTFAEKEAAALLRELAVEPQGKPVAWWIPKAEQFALAKKDGSRPFAKAWEPLYAAPQQQRKPLSQDDVRAFAKFAGLDWQRGYVVDDIHNRYEDFARYREGARHRRGSMTMPPLPTGHTIGCGIFNGQKLFTADQMRAYGAACAAAERERIAAWLDAEHEKRKHLDNHAAFYAAAIRAQETSWWVEGIDS